MNNIGRIEQSARKPDRPSHPPCIATTPGSSQLESRCDQASHPHCRIVTLNCLVSPDFRIGSKCEMLIASGCFPLCSRTRTLLRALAVRICARSGIRALSYGIVSGSDVSRLRQLSLPSIGPVTDGPRVGRPKTEAEIGRCRSLPEEQILDERSSAQDEHDQSKQKK